MGNQSLLWVKISPNFPPILIINLSINIISINCSMQTNYKFKCFLCFIIKQINKSVKFLNYTFVLTCDLYATQNTCRICHMCMLNLDLFSSLVL